MKVKEFQVNHKKYKLYYTESQKDKIDYMHDWKNTIARLKWLIKNDKIKKDRGNVQTSYIARAIDYYSFFIEHLTENQFMIKDGYFWDM